MSGSSNSITLFRKCTLLGWSCLGPKVSCTFDVLGASYDGVTYGVCSTMSLSASIFFPRSFNLSVMVEMHWFYCRPNSSSHACVDFCKASSRVMISSSSMPLELASLLSFFFFCDDSGWTSASFSSSCWSCSDVSGWGWSSWAWMGIVSFSYWVHFSPRGGEPSCFQSFGQSRTMVSIFLAVRIDCVENHYF